MIHATGYTALSADSAMTPFSFTRRALRANDVRADIRYCGVCHSDLHQARNDWHNSLYPCVPGHEIVGQVTEIGADVTRFEVGDMAAISCLVDSCMECSECTRWQEQYCARRATPTYNGKDRIDGSPTFGGYSNHIVAREQFVLKLPEGLDRERAAPFLCAGGTTWSPLRHWRVGPGSRVAVGLGVDVTVVTTSPAKADDALALGANNVLISLDKDAMKAAARSFDYCPTPKPSRSSTSTMPLTGWRNPMSNIASS